MDDDELLRGCQQGDDSALAELVRRYQDQIYRLALRVLADGARAEDAAADALATVWLRCRSWRSEAPAGAWVLRVAWRTVLDHGRARRRWRRFGPLETAAAAPAAAVCDPAQSLADRDEQARLERRLAAALEQMSPADRALVHLHYFEGQNLAEIAPVLGASRDALKMRLSRVRKRLEVLLEDEHERA